MEVDYDDLDDDVEYIEDGEEGYYEEQEYGEEEVEDDNYEDASAPTYTIPPREIVAVEHPLIIKNLENGIKTFGRAPNWSKILEGTEDECLPLYLRFRDPTCIPNLSYNSITNNVLLQITVPKRTGRKRKRGSQDPYTDAGQSKSTATIDSDTSNIIQSHSRNDKPASILRKLRDNIDRYSVEVIGRIEQSHRYRGLSDYHQSTSSGPFMSHFQDTAFCGNWGKARDFTLGDDKGWKPNEEIIPPPTYTHHPLPFNWAYKQNALITTEINAETGEAQVVNRSKMPKIETIYLHNDDDVPTEPPQAVPGDPVLKDIVDAIQRVMDERPIWTRRAMTNRLANETGLYLMKPALSYVGYQFRAGPWRDAIIKYGVDPRTDPKYRIYQTMFFKLYDEDERAPNGSWRDVRSEYTKNQVYGSGDCPSHIFDGSSLTLDGKIWQLCDITDPMLVPLIQDAPMAREFDKDSDGYYNNGTMAKIRAIMKTKLMAIRGNKTLPEGCFNIALSIPDFVPDKGKRKVHVPVPDMRLTDEEVLQMREKGVISGINGRGIKRIDSRSKRKKYRRKRKDKSAVYGLMKGPRNSRPSASTRKKGITGNKDKNPKSTAIGGEGDISIRDAMDTASEFREIEDEEVEDGEDDDEEGEDESESESDTTGSEDESEAEREKEMFIKNYEARKAAAAGSSQ